MRTKCCGTVFRGVACCAMWRPIDAKTRVWHMSPKHLKLTIAALKVALVKVTKGGKPKAPQIRVCPGCAGLGLQINKGKHR